MKNLKFFVLAMVAMVYATISLTSCKSDDDDLAQKGSEVSVGYVKSDALVINYTTAPSDAIQAKLKSAVNTAISKTVAHSFSDLSTTYALKTTDTFTENDKKACAEVIGNYFQAELKTAVEAAFTSADDITALENSGVYLKWSYVFRVNQDLRAAGNVESQQ